MMPRTTVCVSLLLTHALWVNEIDQMRARHLIYGGKGRLAQTLNWHVRDHNCCHVLVPALLLPLLLAAALKPTALSSSLLALQHLHSL